MTGRIWQVVIATVLGVALLLGLGAWQLQRLAWKEALLAERDSRLKAAPVSLDTALKEFDADRSVEFLKVKAQGVFQHDAELFVLTTEGGVPGFQVVTPLASTEGVVVLVDRGFIPEPLKDAKRRPDSQPSGDIEVTGLVRRHVQGRGAFTPDNDTVANIWYWWDIPAMLAFARVAPDQRVAPFVLHIEPDPKAGRTLPSPVATDENLTNNHLQYALTWFSLAILLVVMSGFLIRQTRRKGD